MRNEERGTNGFSRLEQLRAGLLRNNGEGEGVIRDPVIIVDAVTGQRCLRVHIGGTRVTLTEAEIADKEVVLRTLFAQILGRGSPTTNTKRQIF